jgi:C_GCAxxG_C_C family probable redox protein
MHNTSEAALALFAEGYSCAQSAFAACAQPFGLPKETAIKIAQAFGGGIGGSGSVCGAVTGALMALGFSCSAKDGQDLETKMHAKHLTQDFLQRFSSQHGSLLCRELIGQDLTTPEGLNRAIESGVFQKICPGLVRDGVQTLQAVLAASETAPEHH